MKIKLLFFFVFLPIVIIKAQLSSFDYNGYAKYLFSSSKSSMLNDRLNDHLLHSRFNSKWYATDAITAALEFRFRAFYGESVEKIPSFKDLIQTPRDFVKLDVFLWESEKSIGYLEIDRLWLDWYTQDLQVTVGKTKGCVGNCLGLESN